MSASSRSNENGSPPFAGAGSRLKSLNNGPGADAVVAPDLRIRGLEGLRIVDASVMPFVASCNPQRADGHDRGKGVRHDSRAPCLAGGEYLNDDSA
jgi:hypothetical protein